MKTQSSVVTMMRDLANVSHLGARAPEPAIVADPTCNADSLSLEHQLLRGAQRGGPYVALQGVLNVGGRRASVNEDTGY